MLFLFAAAAATAAVVTPKAAQPHIIYFLVDDRKCFHARTFSCQIALTFESHSGCQKQDSCKFLRHMLGMLLLTATAMLHARAPALFPFPIPTPY